MTSPTNKKWSLLLILFAFSLSAFAADSLPTAQDINDTAQKAKQIYGLVFHADLHNTNAI